MNNFSHATDSTRFTSWKDILSGIHYEKILHDDSQTEPCGTAWAAKLATIHPSELSEQECAGLAEHVVTCSACAAILCEYKMMEDLFDDQQDETQEVQEPTFTIPPKVLRIWEFQDEQKRITSYTKVKEQVERKRYIQRLLPIAFLQIIAIPAVTLLVMAIHSASTESLFSEIPHAFLHLMQAFQVNAPGIVHSILPIMTAIPALIINIMTIRKYVYKKRSEIKVYKKAKAIAHRRTLTPDKTPSGTAG